MIRVLVIDVELNQFKSFIRDDGAFFYVETEEAFILIKPKKEYTARTIVTKSFGADDDTFRFRMLNSYTAISCKDFVLDGKSLFEVKELIETDSSESEELENADNE